MYNTKIFFNEFMHAISENSNDQADDQKEYVEVLVSLGVPQNHLETMISLCRERIASTSELRKCIDSYECPAGLNRRFFFSKNDFSNNYKGAERKIEDLRGCQSNLDCRYKPEDIED